MNDTITELAALEAKATPLPLRASNIGGYYPIYMLHDDHTTERMGLFYNEHDANLYVAMRNALPELLSLAQAGKALEESKERAIPVLAELSIRIVAAEERADKAEAELDVLAEALADGGGDCPYLAFWQDCPEERPAWCECTDTDDSGFECCWHGGAQRCWLKWAAQEAAEREGDGE